MKTPPTWSVINSQ